MAYEFTNEIGVISNSGVVFKLSDILSSRYLETKYEDRYLETRHEDLE